MLGILGAPEVPKRWEMALLLSSGLAIIGCLRVNMSVAAIDMREELNWSETEKGLVLSAFYWGYTLGQIPASRFAAMYGAKLLFGLSILVPCIGYLFVPMACRTSFALALFTRAICGLFESGTYPCLFHFFPSWIPLNEKALLVSIITSGFYLGEIVGFALSGYLTTTPHQDIRGWTIGGWDTGFFFFGACGILWYPIWLLYAHERPDDHPTISIKEFTYINKGKDTELVTAEVDNHYYQAGEQPLHRRMTAEWDTGPNYEGDDEERVALVRYKESPAKQRAVAVDAVSGVDVDGTRPNEMKILSNEVPWAIILKHPTVLTLFVMGWCHGWVNFTLLTEMPSFLTDMLKFDLRTAGALSAVPFIMLFLSVVGSGRFFHWLQEKHGWQTRTVRLTAQFIAFSVSSVALVMCGYMENVGVAYFFMTLAQGSTGFSNSGFLCSFLDITPNHSALLNSIANTVGAAAGIAGPIVVGILTTAYPGVWGWRLVFYTCAIQCGFALVLWYLFQRSDIIPEINSPVKSSERKNEK